MRRERGPDQPHPLFSISKGFQDYGRDKAINEGRGPLSPCQPLKELRDVQASGLAATRLGHFTDGF